MGFNSVLLHVVANVCLASRLLFVCFVLFCFNLFLVFGFARNRRVGPVSAEYYTDIDRDDGNEISRFGGLPRELVFPRPRDYIFAHAALRENIIPRENILHEKARPLYCYMV